MPFLRGLLLTLLPPALAVVAAGTAAAGVWAAVRGSRRAWRIAVPGGVPGGVPVAVGAVSWAAVRVDHAAAVRLAGSAVDPAWRVAGGDPVPAFTLAAAVPDVGGDRGPVASADLRGRAVLVNFFAVACPPCRLELPRLDAARAARRYDRRYALPAVGRGETADAPAAFAAETGLSLPLHPDPDGATSAAFAAGGVPRTALLAPDGTVDTLVTGYGGREFDRLLERWDVLAGRVRP